MNVMSCITTTRTTVQSLYHSPKFQLMRSLFHETSTSLSGISISFLHISINPLWNSMRLSMGLLTSSNTLALRISCHLPLQCMFGIPIPFSSRHHNTKGIRNAFAQLKEIVYGMVFPFLGYHFVLWISRLWFMFLSQLAFYETIHIFCMWIDIVKYGTTKDWCGRWLALVWGS